MNTERTPEQIAAELYPKFEGEISGYRKDYNKITGIQREAWLSGLQVGAEFAEWCDVSPIASVFWRENRIIPTMDGSHRVRIKELRAELLQIFLNEKYGK
jgi:hypothetical protein